MDRLYEKTTRQLTPYIYDELYTESSFRVLELLPGEWDDEISYKLVVADWNDPPAYVAISYAWGNVNDKVPTLCHGSILMVTPNLRSALRHMRLQDQSRLLWADAACINQGDIAEQGCQVSHIRLIYEQAKQVLVWLGEDEQNQAAPSAQLVRAIGEASCARNGMSFETLKSCDKICNMTLQVPGADLPPPQDPAWNSLAWLFQRHWFSRLWVFQEVNCGRDVLMLCGTESLSWDFVALAANYVRARPHLSQQHNFASGYYENACIMRRRYLHAQSSVLHMLNSTKNFVTSNPLDRIYALIATPPFTKLDPPLKVDYNKTKLELYQELAVRCICENRDLGVLGYSQDTAENEGFPSWVPDWEKRNWEYLIDHPHGEALSASGSTLFSGPVPVNSVLITEGILFDVVDRVEMVNLWDCFDKYGVALPRHTTPSSPSQSEDMAPNVRRVSTETMSKDPSYQSRHDVECLQSLLSGFAQYVARLLQLSKRDQAEIEMLDEDGGENGKSSSRAASYQVEPRSKAWDRTFFVTKNEHFGFAPRSLAQADMVCILYGGKVPFILRSVDEHYLLVGPAYVKGIMEGETLDSTRASMEQCQRRTFNIH